MVDECCDRVVSLEPLFALVSVFLVEGEVDLLIIGLVLVVEVDLVIVDCAEVFFGVFGGGRAKTFVVFDL